MIQLTFTQVDRVSEMPRQIRPAVSQVWIPNYLQLLQPRP